jgi:pyruvate carboxylase
MAGLCRPYAAEKLVKALRQEVGIPIHFHTHDTSGLNAASILKAAESGVHVADGAISSMSGTTSQPNLNSIVAALAHTKRETGLDLDALNQCADYWEVVSTRGPNPGRPKSTCTKCPAGSTPISKSRRNPWVSARGGMKSRAPTPRSIWPSATLSR